MKKIKLRIKLLCLYFKLLLLYADLVAGDVVIRIRSFQIWAYTFYRLRIKSLFYEARIVSRFFTGLIRELYHGENFIAAVIKSIFEVEEKESMRLDEEITRIESEIEKRNCNCHGLQD